MNKLFHSVLTSSFTSRRFELILHIADMSFELDLFFVDVVSGRGKFLFEEQVRCSYRPVYFLNELFEGLKW